MLFEVKIQIFAISSWFAKQGNLRLLLLVAVFRWNDDNHFTFKLKSAIAIWPLSDMYINLCMYDNVTLIKKGFVIGSYTQASTIWYCACYIYFRRKCACQRGQEFGHSLQLADIFLVQIEFLNTVICAWLTN